MVVSLKNNKVLLIKRKDYTKASLYDFIQDKFRGTKGYKKGKCTGLCTSTMLMNEKVLILGIKGNRQEIWILSEKHLKILVKLN